jgi:hypothetical protein
MPVLKEVPVDHLDGATYRKILALLVIFLRKHAADPIPVHGWATVLLGSYVYTDFFTWLQHAYLDKEETLQSPIANVREYAAEFQIHHKNPGGVLEPGAGVAAVGKLVDATATAGILASPVCSTESSLFTLGTIAWGVLAIYNHVLCHAGSRGYRVPGWVSVLRRLGVVPEMQFHQVHHDPTLATPHQQNWSFLCGPSLLYERVFTAAGCPIAPLHALIALGNPVSVTALQALRDPWA